MKAEPSDTSEAPRYLNDILGLTAYAAGTVDIISFAKLGGTLASAMTGNLAFLGLYLARGSFRAAAGSIAALCGFVAGAAIGTLLTRGLGKQQSVAILLRVETVLLAGFILLWVFRPHGSSGLDADLLITLLAVSMGLQSIIGKKIDLSSIPTIVFTSTLTNIVIGFTNMLATGDFRVPVDTRRQLACFFLYFAGALSAGFLIYLHLEVLIALPFAAAILASLAQIRGRR